MNALKPDPRLEKAGLYVHIPFCHVKCRFCDFAAFPGRLADIPRYLRALRSEMEMHRGSSVDTVFIGGGTPTTLDSPGFRELFAAVRANFSIDPHAEITVECNPESTSPETLSVLRKAGVNRLSFGLQATQDRLLAELGRLHDFAGFESAFTAARRAGFDNLNADLMYGLPGQTIADWRESVKRLSDLEPEHISAYALTVEERTAFGRHGVVPDDDLQADMYDWAADFLESLGFAHYEISNFARPGRECRHNLKYWTSRPYIGVGVSAASCDARGVRRQNAPDLTAYLSAVESGRPCVVSEECLPEPEKVGETLMLSLRLKDGIVPGPRGEELYGDCLNRYAGLGFLHRDPATQAYRPTRLGWRLSNRLFEDLLSPAV